MQNRHMFTCPVCGNTEWTEIYKIDKWGIGECTGCGFARIDPLPTQESRQEYYSEEKVIKRNIKEKNSAAEVFQSYEALIQ